MANTELTTSRTIASARVWHAAVAVLTAAALLTQLVLSATAEGETAATRIVRLFSYFTIQSNILLCVVSVTLALRPARREGAVWRVLRLDSVLAMTVTGLVFMTVLRGLEELEGLRAATDAVFHYIAPVAAVVGWFAFGPRPRITGRTLALALIFPIAWVVYILIYSGITGWYPYPFIDADDLGATRVAINVALIAAVFIVLGLIYRYLDRRLPATPDRVA